MWVLLIDNTSTLISFFRTQLADSLSNTKMSVFLSKVNVTRTIPLPHHVSILFNHFLAIRDLDSFCFGVPIDTFILSIVFLNVLYQILLLLASSDFHLVLIILLNSSSFSIGTGILGRLTEVPLRLFFINETPFFIVFMAEKTIMVQLVLINEGKNALLIIHCLSFERSIQLWLAECFQWKK